MQAATITILKMYIVGILRVQQMYRNAYTELHYIKPLRLRFEPPSFPLERYFASVSNKAPHYSIEDIIVSGASPKWPRNLNHFTTYTAMRLNG